MTNTTSPTHAPLTGLFSQPKRPRKASALLLGTALGAIVGLGYGRGAYAQTILSGTNTTTQTLTGPGEFVTEEGFSVDTSGGSGNGITITTPSGETGDTTFTDNFSSSITGDKDGIQAENYGTGLLSITTSAVIEAGSDGIEAVNKDSSGSGDLRVTANGTVTGGSNPGHAGIDARNESTGNLTISTAKVDGSGGASGIRAGNSTGGSVKISSTGLVEGSKTGISALNGDQNTVDLIIQSADVYGLGVDRGQGVAAGGIAADNQGTGALSITSSGNVEDTTYFGIYARASGIGAAGAEDLAGNSLEGVSLAIDANNVTGGTDGINAENRGSGALSITSSGTVTGTAEDGIYANNSTAGTDLTIAANIVVGGSDGIDARNQGDGALAVTTSGPIVANNGNGIYARNGEWSGDFYTDGYCRTSSGSKNCSPVDPENFPQYDPAGTDLTITSTGPVTGSEVGIFAYNNGSGALTITANGDVTGDTAIRAQQYDIYGFVRSNENFDFSLNESTGTDLSITAVGDLNATDGPAVSAVNYGTGSLTVDVTGDVVSTGSSAVKARNQYGGDIRISLLGDVESPGRAIDALNGSYNTRDGYVGSLDIYVAGNLHSRSSDAIRGRLRYDGDLEITVTGDVVAGNEGIEAEHRATGNMVIDIGGNVTANPESGGSEGIDSEHRGNGDMTIIVGGDITSGSEGILAAHKGDGDMSITTYGMIQTSNHEGLDVDHEQGNGSINISINGDVIAADDGIEVDHGGTGDITISSGTVTGGTDGIDVVHDGTGALSITTTGTVTGTAQSGISASTSGSGALSIVAEGAITGGDYGVYAYARPNSLGGVTIDV